MMTIIVWLHLIVCVGLIGIILVQRGRGGGLVDSFSSLESMFGTKTSVFLTKLTTVLAITFFSTCLTLAFFSIKQSRSLLHGVKVKAKAGLAVNTTASEPVNSLQNTTGQTSAAKEEKVPTAK